MRSRLKNLSTTSRKDLLRFATALLIGKVTIGVVSNYTDYVPPNFDSVFLMGRQNYFFGSYSIAFYAHIVAGPLSLFLGLLLMSHRFRRRFRGWHARLGRVQIAIVLFVSGSGLWMSPRAETGALAVFGFAALAVATGSFALLGMRSAMRQRFVEHQCWMWRCFLCLCSAVVLRLTAGLAMVVHWKADWLYPAAAWGSWLIPLAIYELNRLRDRKPVAKPQVVSINDQGRTVRRHQSS